MPVGKDKVPDGSVRFGDDRDDFVRHVSELGIPFEIKEFEDEDGRQTSLYVNLPNGRDVRKLRVGPSIAKSLLRADLSGVVFLKDYVAYCDRTSGYIEAQIRSIGRGAVTSDLRLLPGVRVNKDVQLSEESAVEQVDPEMAGSDDDDVEEVEDGPSREVIDYHNWHLSITSDESPLEIEISPVTDRFVALNRLRVFAQRPDISIKIKGVFVTRHDELVLLLEQYSRALFFEIDLKFNVSLSLVKERRLPLGGSVFRGRRLGGAPLGMPKNKYAAPATDLYFYARSAAGMPLLQYLAYYQAIEFFFPSFFHSEVIRRLRQELRDPRFNVDDDGELQRLLSIASSSGRSGVSERQQLRATLAACVDNDSVESFIRGEMVTSKIFTEKKLIEDVPDLNVKSSVSLVDQVAERVYAIRCRIVHTKEDGGAIGAKVMLPFGTEAQNLGPDIMLMRFLAQKVIIAGSRGSL